MKPLVNAIYKKIIFFSLLFSSLLFSLILSAKEVTLKTAKQVAINVFSESAGLAKSSIKIQEVIPIENNGILLYRIFNFSPTGYIVISADDDAEPVIGYGLDNNFSFNDAPPALLFLLGEYKEEMSYIIEKGLKGNEEINSKWKKFSDESYVSLKSYTVGDYLLETTWGQGNKNSSTDYNKECPDDPNTGKKCIAGCNAVALAQILHYWECRVFPDGTESYTPLNFSNSLTIN